MYIVYLELLRREYKVYIGKMGDTEIDFVAEKAGIKNNILISFYKMAGCEPAIFMQKCQFL